MTEQARESMTSKNRSQPHYIPVCLAKFVSKDWDFMQRSTILSNSSGANTANNERAQQDKHKFLEAGSPPFLLLMLFGSSCERKQISLLIPVCVIFRVCLGITADVPQYIITTFGLWPVHVMLNHYLHFCLSTCETAPAMNIEWQKM